MWSLFSCGVVCGLLERPVPESCHHFVFLWLGGFVMDSVFSCILELSSVLACHPAVCLSQHWDLCILDAHADFANSSKYIYVCKRARMRTHATMHLSTWTLTPSLINVRGLSQALHAAFCCDRQILGPPVAPGVRVGTMHDASTKTALPLIKQTCAIHTASALY